MHSFDFILVRYFSQEQNCKLKCSYFLYYKGIAQWSSGLHCNQQEICCHFYFCCSKMDIFSSGSYLVCLGVVLCFSHVSFVLVFFGLLGFVGLQFLFNLEDICLSFLKLFVLLKKIFVLCGHPHPYSGSGAPNTRVLECFKLSHSSLSGFFFLDSFYCHAFKFTNLFLYNV